jgi:competence ComEA-like helix-hairpin-helix protein
MFPHISYVCRYSGGLLFGPMRRKMITRKIRFRCITQRVDLSQRRLGPRRAAIAIVVANSTADLICSVQIQAISREGIMMKLASYSTAVLLCVFIVAPVAAQTASPPKSPAATTAPSTASPATGGLVDINSASAEELDKLPGVGPVRAKAIISHRPYNGKDDLVQRKVIPQNVYDQINDKIIARQGTRAPAGSPSGAAKNR